MTIPSEENNLGLEILVKTFETYESSVVLLEPNRPLIKPCKSQDKDLVHQMQVNSVITIRFISILHRRCYNLIVFNQQANDDTTSKLIRNGLLPVNCYYSLTHTCTVKALRLIHLFRRNPAVELWAMYRQRLTFIWSSIWFSLLWWGAKCSCRIQGGRTTIWLAQTTSYHWVAHHVEVYSSVYSPPITAELTQNEVMPISVVNIKSCCT